MIISYSNDFIFIRIPKCASTTCVVGLYDMGFVNEEEGDISTGIEAGTVNLADGNNHKAFNEIDSGRKPINWPYGDSPTILPLLDHNMVNANQHIMNANAHRQHIWHSPYSKFVESGLIEEGMPCVSTIRHPVDRWISITAYVGSFSKKENTTDPNVSWERFKNEEETFDMWSNMFKLPQHYYVSDDAQLWNVENVYDWLKRFAKEKGIVYNQPYHFKNNKKRQKIPLTENRKQEIMDYFEKDFLLWEKAYREFN